MEVRNIMDSFTIKLFIGLLAIFLLMVSWVQANISDIEKRLNKLEGRK
jgi:hypothetical protein